MGIMEKKMETIIMGHIRFRFLGFRVLRVSRVFRAVDFRV